MNISKDWDNVLGITNEYSDAKIKTPPTTTLADTSKVPNKIMLVLLNMKYGRVADLLNGEEIHKGLVQLFTQVGVSKFSLGILQYKKKI